jgi:hypothetical protein
LLSTQVIHFNHLFIHSFTNWKNLKNFFSIYTGHIIERNFFPLEKAGCFLRNCLILWSSYIRWIPVGYHKKK